MLKNTKNVYRNDFIDDQRCQDASILNEGVQSCFTGTLHSLIEKTTPLTLDHFGSSHIVLNYFV